MATESASTDRTMFAQQQVRHPERARRVDIRAVLGLALRTFIGFPILVLVAILVSVFVTGMLVSTIIGYFRIPEGLYGFVSGLAFLVSLIAGVRLFGLYRTLRRLVFDIQAILVKSRRADPCKTTIDYLRKAASSGVAQRYLTDDALDENEPWTNSMLIQRAARQNVSDGLAAVYVLSGESEGIQSPYWVMYALQAGGDWFLCQSTPKPRGQWSPQEVAEARSLRITA